MTPTWTIETDVGPWLIIRPDPDEESVASARELVVLSLATASGEQKEPAMTEDEDGEFLAEVAADAVARLVEFAGAMSEQEAVVAAVGVSGRTPVPVHVLVYAHDASDPADLLASCGAKEGGWMYPPSVEYPDISDGDAVRVTRIDADDEGAAWATVALARRTETADTVLTWRTTDIPLLAVMPELLNELLEAIVVSGGPT